MKLSAESLISRHRRTWMVGAIALVSFALLGAAARANADQVYWANQSSIAYSKLDDTAGGFLPASVNVVNNVTGTAIDTADGRIYVSEESPDRIVWFALDGGASGIVNTVPGSVDHPSNIAIDPGTQTLYWANAVNPGSIGFIPVSESGGGILTAPGKTDAHVHEPTRLAIDVLHHRVYWWNAGGEDFSWVETDGLLGGNLSTPGLTGSGPDIAGIALEPFSTPEELYFVSVGGIFHTDPILGGAPEGVKEVFKNNTNDPIGLAYDGVNERFYWANSGVDEERKEAIGTATLFGHAATVAVFPVAPIHSPVFAAILKAPVSTGDPQLAVDGTAMSCTVGEWEGDHPGASVYAAPTSFSYQWKKGSEEIAGATGNTFTATETGSYSCQITATNAAGETAKSTRSASMSFPAKPKTTTSSSSSSTSTAKQKPKPTPGSVGAKLVSTKPVKVKAGGTAAIAVDLANSGGTTSGSTKVCGKLAKGAKKGLKAPACVTVKSVAAGKTAVAKLSVKTLASAKGTYKLTVSVSGGATASLAAKVQIARPKGKK